MEKQKSNPFVGIAGAIGGISVAIVTIFAVLAKEHLYILPWIVGALAILGIALGYFAAKASK